MRKTAWGHRLGFAALALTLLILPACTDGHFTFFGYTSKPNYDTTICTVYVPMAGNKTMVHGSLEFDVTREVMNQINLKTPYKAVHSRVGADTELLITVANVGKSTINQNQNGEIRESQVNYVFEVVWLDRRPGRAGDVLSGPKRRDGTPLPVGPDGKVLPPAPVIISPVATYIPELGGSTAVAQQQIIQQLATQVVSMMEASGTQWK